MPAHYDKVSLRFMSDESIVRLLIAVVRDCHDPELPGELRPRPEDVASVVVDVLERLERGSKALDTLRQERAHARRQARA